MSWPARVQKRGNKMVLNWFVFVMICWVFVMICWVVFCIGFVIGCWWGAKRK